MADQSDRIDSAFLVRVVIAAVIAGLVGLVVSLVFREESGLSTTTAPRSPDSVVETGPSDPRPTDAPTPTTEGEDPFAEISAVAPICSNESIDVPISVDDPPSGGLFLELVRGQSDESFQVKKVDESDNWVATVRYPSTGEPLQGAETAGYFGTVKWGVEPVSEPVQLTFKAC